MKNRQKFDEKIAKNRLEENANKPLGEKWGKTGWRNGGN